MAARLYALRVKIKTLAIEARIIRHEERRFPTRKQRKRAMHDALEKAGLTNQQIGEIRRGERPMPNDIALPKWVTRKRDNPIYTSLHHHRTVLVRSEARLALLAYAFVRERPYAAIERRLIDAPTLDIPALADMVRRFGGDKWEPRSRSEVQARIQSWLLSE